MSDTAAGAEAHPHLYLVDGSGFIFRAYHALARSRPLTRDDGTPVGAVYGFSSMLMKLLTDADDGDKPTHMAVIFDTKRKTFRSDIYPDYKANRPPPPEDLVPQFPLVREATRAFGLPSLEMEGYEADDLIATYATEAKARGWWVTIVSSDKDLMQLVHEECELLDGMKNTRTGPDGVVAKFGVPPEKVIDVQSLAGDSVDNVPGVPGIGIKTAAQLITDYGDLDSLLERASEIKQTKRRENLIEFAEQARISRQLVTLKTDAPTPAALDDLVRHSPDAAELGAFLDAQQFRSLKVKAAALFADGEAAGGLISETDQKAAITRQDYSCITDMPALEAWVARIKKAGYVALDTETTSLNVVAADLVGISLAVEAGEACYIPLGHTGADGDDLLADRPDQLDKAAVIAALKPLLEDDSILKIGQNLKYDLSILAAEGIAVAPIADTMLMSYALDGGRHGHGMDELSGLHLDITPVPYKQVVGTGKSQISFAQVPLDKATDYAAEDADITLRLHSILQPRLAAEQVSSVYHRLERPLSPILAAMERAGVKVDAAELTRLSQEFASRIATLEGQIFAAAGRDFNINSPKQLGEILFDEMGISGGKRSKKTGAYATGADILEKLAAEGHKLPELVLEYRQFAKLKSTYTDALAREIQPRTGRVHTSYHMAATTTGRLSSNDPNLQNIPIRTDMGRRIRRAFVPETGHTLIAADYSQIELRILAHMANIDALRQAFADGLDIHAMTASEVFGEPIEGMAPAVRRQAKAINFGIIYGISAFGLARQLGIERGEAQRYIDAYFAKFPGIRRYMDATIMQAKEQGFVTTLFGRKSHIRALSDKNPATRQFGERAAINAPIQGSAADIIRRAMIRMPEALRSAGLSDVRMLMQVHDELVFEAPDGLVERAIPLIKATMEDACAPVVDLSVPLVVDVGTGQNWDDAH